MRRAMREGKHLGMAEPFLHALVAVLAREMGDAYPELQTHREMIEETILAEEHRFDAVLTDGLPRLEAEIAKALETPSRVLPGDAAVRLWQLMTGWLEFPQLYETQRPKQAGDLEAIATTFRPYLEARDWITIQKETP